MPRNKKSETSNDDNLQNGDFGVYSHTIQARDLLNNFQLAVNNFESSLVRSGENTENFDAESILLRILHFVSDWDITKNGSKKSSENNVAINFFDSVKSGLFANLGNDNEQQAIAIFLSAIKILGECGFIKETHLNSGNAPKIDRKRSYDHDNKFILTDSGSEIVRMTQEVSGTGKINYNSSYKISLSPNQHYQRILPPSRNLSTFSKNYDDHLFISEEISKNFFTWIIEQTEISYTAKQKNSEDSETQKKKKDKDKKIVELSEEKNASGSTNYKFTIYNKQHTHIAKELLEAFALMAVLINLDPGSSITKDNLAELALSLIDAIKADVNGYYDKSKTTKFGPSKAKKFCEYFKENHHNISNKTIEESLKKLIELGVITGAENDCLRIRSSDNGAVIFRELTDSAKVNGSNFLYNAMTVILNPSELKETVSRKRNAQWTNMVDTGNQEIAVNSR